MYHKRAEIVVVVVRIKLYWRGLHFLKRNSPQTTRRLPYKRHHKDETMMRSETVLYRQLLRKVMTAVQETV